MLLPVFVICTLRLLSHCSNKIHTIKTAQFLSFKTGCSYPRITVSSWCPDQDIRNYYPKILNYFGIIIINWTDEGVPPTTHTQTSTDEGVPPTTHTQTSNNEGAPPPQLTRRRRCPPTTHTETRVFTRHPHTDEGVPPRFTRRRGCSPRHSRTDEGVPPAIHIQTKGVPPPHTCRRQCPYIPPLARQTRKRGYPNKRKLTFKLLDVLISSRLQVLDKTF